MKHDPRLCKLATSLLSRPSVGGKYILARRRTTHCTIKAANGQSYRIHTRNIITPNGYKKKAPYFVFAHLSASENYLCPGYLSLYKNLHEASLQSNQRDSNTNELFILQADSDSQISATVDITNKLTGVNLTDTTFDRFYLKKMHSTLTHLTSERLKDTNLRCVYFTNTSIYCADFKHRSLLGEMILGSYEHLIAVSAICDRNSILH